MQVTRTLLLHALAVITGLGCGGLSGSDGDGDDGIGGARPDEPDASARPGRPPFELDPDAAPDGAPSFPPFCYLGEYCTTAAIGPSGFDLTTFQNLPADRTGVTIKNLETSTITVSIAGCAGSGSVTLGPNAELTRHLDESPLDIGGTCVNGASHVSATGYIYVVGSFTRNAGATYTVYEPGGASWTFP